MCIESLQQELTALLRESFARAALPAEHARVRPSDRPDLADFQSAGAFEAAKAARRPPLQIAEVVAGHAPDELADLAEVSAAQPGFINLRVRDGALRRWLSLMHADPRLGCGREPEPMTVIIDYGGPNVAKPMHVGHLRSAVIGESLKRLFRFKGHCVIGDVHLGDWGLQMGMLIEEVRRFQPDLPYFRCSESATYPAESPVSLDDLARLYPQAARRCEADPQAAEAARRATVELQQGHPGYRALWRHFVELSVADIRREYDELGVSFEQWFGESRYQPMIDGLTEELLALGIARRDNGSVVVDVAAADGEDTPPMLLRKSDGAALYATTDLAAIRERVVDFDADLLLYVVDGRQSLHFAQVFRAAERAGYLDPARAEHIAFGTVNGPDGKPFKTRAGEAVQLGELIATLKDQVHARLRKQNLEQREEADEAVRRIAVGALKFADLQHERTTDYVFEPERYTRFEGRTGPYVQYAAVRLQRLLDKAGREADGPAEFPGGFDERERELGLRLTAWPDAVNAALAQRRPDIVAAHAYEVAVAVSRVYQRCRVLEAETAEARTRRLDLCRLTLRQVRWALHLLGIEVPRWM